MDEELIALIESGKNKLEKAKEAKERTDQAYKDKQAQLESTVWDVLRGLLSPYLRSIIKFDHVGWGGQNSRLYFYSIEVPDVNTIIVEVATQTIDSVPYLKVLYPIRAYTEIHTGTLINPSKFYQPLENIDIVFAKAVESYAKRLAYETQEKERKEQEELQATKRATPDIILMHEGGSVTEMYVGDDFIHRLIKTAKDGGDTSK